MPDNSQPAQTLPEQERYADLFVWRVLDHIDSMYPMMWKLVPKTARTSIRNTLYAELERYRKAVQP